MEILKLIHNLLYGKRYTIEGAQHLIKEKGLKNLLGEEEIQKDFFEAANDDSGNARSTVAGIVDSQSLQKIADAVSELKALRAKLANL